MNHISTLTRSRWLLLTLFTLLVGVSPAWAQQALPYSYGFEDYNLATDGWTKFFGTSITKNNNECAIVGDAKKTGSYGFRFSSYQTSGANAQYLISPEFNAPNGINVSFYYKASNSSGTEKFKVGYSTTDTDVANFTWGEEISTNSTSWIQYENTFPADTKYVAIYYYANYQYRLYVDDFSFTSAASGPALAVADGSTTINSGYNYDFGLTTAGATHYFTLSNPGTENITVNIAATNGFGVSNTNLTLEAKAATLLTVTMPAATASGTVTITPVEAVDPFTINVSGTIADPNKVFETLLTGSIPEGWTTSGGTWSWSTTNGASNTAWYESSNYRLITPKLTIAEGEKFFFDAQGTSSGYQGVIFEYSSDGTTWTASSTTTTVSGEWQTFLINDIPAGNYYIAIHGWHVNVRNFYGGELPNEPKMVVTQPTTLGFGSYEKDASPAPTKTFTIANTGKAVLNGISVTSGNAAFTIAGAPTSLAAGASQDVTITMATGTKGALSSLITVSATGMEDATFTVTGAVLPAGTETIDFNTAIPGGWENQDNGWTIYNNEAAKCTGKKNLTTQKLDFSGEASPFFLMKVKASDSGSGDYITVEGSTDNGTTWTAFDKKTYSYPTDFGNNTGDYSDIVVSIPNTVNKLRFNGYYVLVDEIAGLKYSAYDPTIAVFSDAEATASVASRTTKDFGWANTAQSATYYIKNSGTGTLTISEISAVDGFTAATAGDVMTVAAGADPLALTITMTNAAVGAKSGTFTITTDGGNFEIPVKGFIYSSKNLVDFTDASQYQGWTTEGWTISEGAASVSSSKTMQTTKFSVEANEKLYVEAKSNGSYYSSANLTYSYSTDNGENWTDGAAAIIASTTSSSDYAVYTLSDIADAEDVRTILLRFTGANVAINRIYGFTAVATPVMETTAADIAFGSQTAESTEQTFTISNTGTANLTGLSVTLGKTGEDAEYAVRMEKDDAEFTGTTIAPSEVVTVYVKQLFDINKLGSKSDVLTIAATEQVPVAINLTGTTKDPFALDIDFNSSSEWPAAILEHGDNWTVYNYSGSGEARQGNYSTATSLTLTPLTVTSETDEFKFDVAYYNYSSYRELIVSYTTDGGNTWTDYNWGTEQDPVYDLKQNIGYSYDTKTITGIPAGTVVFKFTGKCIKLDNITGDMKVTSAPLMTLTTVSDGISDANLKADGVAEYTLANNGNAEYVGTVALSNVTAAVAGEGVTYEANKLTIPAGKTATITVTMAYTEPYGVKNGTMVITSESWVGDINKAYTASLVDPTDFNEDFADGKPAGWYSENWVYSGGAAHIYQGVDKPMITEKIGAVEGKNILRFDAKVYYGDDDQTLNVYTSTDRKNWSDAQVFNITSESSTYYLTALAENQYYVKFEAANVAIDNVKGVKKLAAPAHDLFEISNTITGTGVPGAEYTATVTAVSLIADESDIVAELWLKKAEAYYKVASLENQTLTANESKALTLTGNLPDWAAGDGYKMYITVKKSDDAAYFNTDEVDFTLAHNLELTINSFAVTTPAVQADDNNEYTATFNINVTNTGSRDLSAEEVSVSLINKISDPDVVFTSKWTKANSQTIFLNPGEYSNDGAVLALYSWGKENAWTLFTETATTGFYSAELNGNTGFSIVRLKKSTDEGYSSENGGLNWDNKYNQSVDYTVEDGNVFTFTNWDGEKQSFEKSTMATLAKGISTTLQVTVYGTLTDGEDKNLTFYAREDEKNTILDDGYTYVTRTAAITAAPVIELDETAETYDVAANVNNRKVQVARSFNAGWNTICLPFAVSANDLKTQYGENVALYELTSFESNNLQFTQVNTGAEPTGITAGKPYLIYVEDAITTPKTFVAATVFAAAPTDDVKGSATFKGTYTKMAANSLEDKYGVSSDNRIAKGNASTTMKGFRAYLEGALSSARIAIIDETTGITRVYGADEIFGKDDKVYDLNGRRVENAKKGVYIVNGKKIVVK